MPLGLPVAAVERLVYACEVLADAVRAEAGLCRKGIVLIE